LNRVEDGGFLRTKKKLILVMQNEHKSCEGERYAKGSTCWCWMGETGQNHYESGSYGRSVLEDYPELEEEDVKQSLEYAAWTVSERVLPVAL